jgi:hypothetical protein
MLHSKPESHEDLVVRRYHDAGLRLRGYSLLSLWIFLSAWFVITGWVLSLCRALNLFGYTASTVFLVATLISVHRSTLTDVALKELVARLGSRFRKPLPAIFLLTAIVAFIGGLIYGPNNYDFLTYRFSRLLHWLAEGRWHWIATNNERMNYSAPGFEWLVAPLFVFTRSARLFFLVNAISFLLLPGLVFSVLRSFGIRRKIAWQWMWLFPSGYCFATQAGSAGNDIFATVYLLAALAFAAQFNRTGRFAAFVLSAVAAGLLTGAKANNIPLVLPIGVVWLAGFKQLFKRPVTLFLTAMLAGAVSFIPMAILNGVYAGNWTGSADGAGNLKPRNPMAGLAGNVLQLVVNTAQPPLFPFANSWNEFVTNAEEYNPVLYWIRSGFPRFDLSMRELVSEESAGIGFGLGILWVLLIAIGIRRYRGASNAGESNPPDRKILPWLVTGAGVLASLIYEIELASEAGPRLFASYYAFFLMVVLLFVGSHHPGRSRSWQALAVVVAVTPIFLLVLEPARPLFPVDSFIGMVRKTKAPNSLVRRIETVYRTYRIRADVLAPIRETIPDGARVIGFVGNGNQPEVSLWRPFGERRVEDLVDLNNLQAAPQFIVASESGIRDRVRKSPEDWVKQQSLREICRTQLTTLARNGDEVWFLFENNAEARR